MSAQSLGFPQCNADNFVENVRNITTANVYLQDFHKIWTTSGSAELRERKTLYEFADEDKYRQGRENIGSEHFIKSIFNTCLFPQASRPKTIHWSCHSLEVRMLYLMVPSSITTRRRILLSSQIWRQETRDVCRFQLDARDKGQGMEKFLWMTF